MVRIDAPICLAPRLLSLCTHSLSLSPPPNAVSFLQKGANLMHYNAPRFYYELKDATISRFAIAVSCSFGLSAALYAAIAVAGFATFGGHSDAYILNNYSPYDPLATVCRFAVALSTLVTFPIVFIGFRDGFLDAFDVPREFQTDTNLNALTVGLLTMITAIATLDVDLGTINAVGGGALGSCIVFVFPAMMFQRVVIARKQVSYNEGSTGEQLESIVALVLMATGIFLGSAGVIIALR